MSNKNELPLLNRSILDVRNVLMDQLDRLNKDGVDIDKEYLRSQAISMVANPLIQSAKIEADLMAKNPKFKGTAFLPNPTDETKQLGNG